MVRKKQVVVAASSHGFETIALEDLLLDTKNARFGGEKGDRKEQADILDHIVSTFGVDDVLSSLSVNGFFQAEPLVGRRDKYSGKVIVVEGNRRLSACLMLAGDMRAARQETKAAHARKVWASNEKPSIDPLPVIVYGPSSHKKELLSYLGVRHIASSLSWDSYAKAAWIAEVIETGDLELKDVAEMI